MAVLTIRLVPDPVLFKKAQKIRKITARHKKLADDMVETMTEHDGVGLAANQVGVLERICVIQTPEWEEARVFVNPEIVESEGQRVVEEGCLSLPGVRGRVVRSVKVRAKALNLEAKPIKLVAEGLLAQALEHEIDHLNGIMYPEHLDAHSRLYRIDEVLEDSEAVTVPVGDDRILINEYFAEFDAQHLEFHKMRCDMNEIETTLSAKK